VTSVQRLVRPDDVKDAACWYFGLSVEHRPGHKATQRVSRAKWTYWLALTKIGLSYEEVADVTGVARSGVAKAIRRHRELEDHLEAVLSKATELART
jgi:hypothetical protein